MYFIPGAIMLAGLIIAGAVVFTGNGSENDSAFTRIKSNGDTEQTAGVGNFRPIGDADHVRGNPDAEITIVEFSDFECPFCKRFHPTMMRIIEEFNDVKWVYRHFPLTSIHSNAQDAAIASECVAQLAGNDAFWQFTDAVFDNQKELGTSLYKEIAEGLNINQEAFNSCLNDREAITHVNDDLREAIASGGTGTPFSVVITSDGQFTSFSGALSYENVVVVIERARNN